MLGAVVGADLDGVGILLGGRFPVGAPESVNAQGVVVALVPGILHDGLSLGLERGFQCGRLLAGVAFVPQLLDPVVQTGSSLMTDSS